MESPGSLLATDLLALIITSAVFLAGFSSRRLHASVNEKKRSVDEVVSSVTTTPGYATTLSRLNDQVSEAASGSDRAVGKGRLAEAISRGDNLALTDRDLQPAAAQFPVASLSNVDRVAWRTLCAVGALIALVVALSLWVGVDVATSEGSTDWQSLLRGIIASGVGIIVLTVAVLDYRSIDRDYQQFASALAIAGLTPTYWRPVPDQPCEPQRTQVSVAAVSRAWSVNRGLLQVSSDALVTHQTDCGSDQDHRAAFASATQLVPEWSSPWMRLAYEGWRHTMLQCHIDSPQLGTQATNKRQLRLEALAHAHVATGLNPLDPGCRLLLAALAIDLLAADMGAARLASIASGESESESEFHGWSALSTPLPLSDTNSREPNSDKTRPWRWRISQALRFAREASILVELKWEAVQGRRAAAGRLTDLDGIAAQYQMARAYLLSASNDPDSALSRRNAESASKRMTKVMAGLDGLSAVDQHLASGDLGIPIDGYHFAPKLLCLSEVVDLDATPTGAVSSTPTVAGGHDLAELQWWATRARWLQQRPDRVGLLGASSGVGCFADIWADQ